MPAAEDIKWYAYRLNINQNKSTTTSGIRTPIQWNSHMGNHLEMDENYKSPLFQTFPIFIQRSVKLMGTTPTMTEELVLIPWSYYKARLLNKLIPPSNLKHRS